VAVELDPVVARLVGEGHAARSMLAAMEAFCGALVEDSLKALDRQLSNQLLTPETALSLCHEIGAYRRILQRLRNRVIAGEKAEMRHATEQRAKEEQSA
jgi:hypothetical protein